MTFAAPMMLIGLATITLPILIHLMDRARSEAVDWPSLRFIMIARQQSSQRARIKHWLVLLARCLLLALLFLAMAMPYVQDETWAAPKDKPTTLVLVIDQSFSMGYRLPDGQTRLERAKRLAHEQIGKLALNDEVALVVAGENPQVVTARPTADFDAVAAMVDQVKLAPRGTDLGAALAVAFGVGKLDAMTPEALEQQAAAGEDAAVRPPRDAWRQVVVLTDLQAHGWGRVTSGKWIEQMREPLPVSIIDVSGAQTANRYIRRVRMGPVSSDGRMTLSVEVVGEGGGERVRLWIDDQQAGSPELAPASGGTVELAAPLPAPGFHRCRVELEDDRLPIDNTWHFAIDVAAGSQLIIVNGAPSPIERLNETHFLDLALRLGPQRHGNVTVRRYSPDQLGSVNLGVGGGLILANVPRLDGTALSRIENFIKTGGHVFIALGDKVDIEHYNKDWWFLPLELTRPLGDPARTRAYGLIVRQRDHELFQGLMDLSPVRYFAFIGSNPETLHKDARVLVEFTNGSPALVEVHYGGGEDRSGAGRVLLLTGPIDADWSTFPYRRVYLPLIDRLVSSMTQQRLRWRTVEMGEPIRFMGPQAMVGQPVTVTAPDGSVRSFSAIAEAHTRRAVVDYHETDRAGVYRVEADERFTAPGGFAVNLDARESQLRQAPTELLREAFGDHPIRITQDQPTTLAGWHLQNVQRREQDRRAYWPWLLLAALAVFVTETALANAFTRRKAAVAPPTTEYLGRAAARRGAA